MRPGRYRQFISEEESYFFFFFLQPFTSSRSVRCSSSSSPSCTSSWRGDRAATRRSRRGGRGQVEPVPERETARTGDQPVDQATVRRCWDPPAGSPSASALPWVIVVSGVPTVNVCPLNGVPGSRRERHGGVVGAVSGVRSRSRSPGIRCDTSVSAPAGIRESPGDRSRAKRREVHDDVQPGDRVALNCGTTNPPGDAISPCSRDGLVRAIAGRRGSADRGCRTLRRR